MRITSLCTLAAALLLPAAAMGQPMGGRGWDGWQDRPGPMGPAARQAPAHGGQECPFCRMRQGALSWRQNARAPQGPWMAHGFGRRGQEMMPQQPGRHGRGGEGIGPMPGRFGMRRHGQGMAQGQCGQGLQARPGETLRQMWQQHAQHAGAGAPGVGGRAHGMMMAPSLAPEKAPRPQRPQAPQAAMRDPGLAQIQTELSALAKELREIRQDVTALRKEVAQMKASVGGPQAPPTARPGMPGRGMMGPGMPGRGMMGPGRLTPTHPDPESDPD